MADNPIGDSAQDFGSTSQFVGTVGTTPVSVPSVAGNPIALAFVRCPTNQSGGNRLLFSFDGGTTYQSLSVGEFIGWPVKGNLTQILIKGSTSGVSYEVLLNREPT